MTDWAVWPIFLLQGFIFIVMLLPKAGRFLNIRFEVWVGVLLFVAAITIAASVHHDGSTVLHLHF